MPLDTSPRLAEADEFFDLVMQAHRQLDAEASRRFDARLALILANHIGDMGVLREAVALARGDGLLARGEDMPADGQRMPAKR